MPTVPLYAQELPGAFKRYTITIAATGEEGNVEGLEGGAVVYGVGLRSLATGTECAATLRSAGGSGQILPSLNGRTLTASGASGGDVVMFPCGIEMAGPIRLGLGGTFTTAVVEILAVAAGT